MKFYFSKKIGKRNEKTLGWPYMHYLHGLPLKEVAGRDEVCGIRDQMCGIKDQKGGIWDHSPGIRDHKR